VDKVDRPSRWHRLAPWYDALLLSGLGLAFLSWALDRATDTHISVRLSAACLIATAVALRPLTRRLQP